MIGEILVVRTGGYEIETDLNPYNFSSHQLAYGVLRLIENGCKQRHFALMSGNFSEQDLARGSELGCMLFTKPLDLEQVKDWVEQVERSISSERVLFDWA